MSEQQNQGSNSSGVSKGRRRLLKASAAAPLVATLHPGAALAASSAFQCAGGDFSNKKFEDNGNSINGDTAMRVEIDYYERIGNAARLPDGTKLNQKKLYLIDGQLFDQDGEVHYLNDDVLDDYYEHGVTHVLELYDIGDNYISKLGPWPKYQLNQPGTPLVKSCWSSLIDAGYYL